MDPGDELWFLARLWSQDGDTWTGRHASRRFDIAVEVTPEVAGLIYGAKYDPSTGLYRRGDRILRNKNGHPRTFATFGSATRSIQPFLDWEDPGEPACWKTLRDSLICRPRCIELSSVDFVFQRAQSPDDLFE